MRTKSFDLVIAAPVLAMAFTVVTALRAESPAAVTLTGRATSAAEGPMEGVDVSAKRAGSTITVTVITDATGQYRFPASRLAPGSYALQIRAVGYDLAGPKSATVVAGATTTANLRLETTSKLADQLSNAEWLLSMPGTNEQKSQLADCTGCHTLQRIVDSHYDKNDFLTNVLPRMAGYASSSFWLKPQSFKNGRPGFYAFVNEQMAAYLATVNQSSSTRTWPLKTLQRLTGASTHVIITMYDMPRRQIQPHDVIGTSDGMIWYSDFGQQFLGMLDPKSGNVTEYPIPEFKPGYITGTLELEKDPSENIWISGMYQGGIYMFDRATRTFKQWQVAPADHPEFTQESMVMPVHSNADGKVWTNNQDDISLRRLDIATGSWETFGPFFYSYGGNPQLKFGSYGLVSDSKNTVWMFDFAHAAIGHFDGKTFKAIPTPTANSRPRRGRVDDRTGIVWFAEYGANQIGAYDTNFDNGNIKEYPLPTPWDYPYDVVSDESGRVWTAGMSTDRVSRLDPTTGKVTDWQLPTETNTRRVWVDNTKTPITFWTGSNHGAAIYKVEPLP